MRAKSSAQLLIFLHLPKTAGRTLLRIIEHQYSSNLVLPLYQTRIGEELVTLPPSRLLELHLVIGHFYFGIHDLFPRPSTYFTMVRDPIDRIISHYYFVRGKPTHDLYPLSQQVSLAEYVECCGRAEPNNDQTRLLAGIDLMPDSGECLPEMLPIAKKNLKEHFAVVGLTEEFDRSLYLMKHVFGWKIPLYVKQNVTRDKPRREAISKDTLEVIRTYNELDIELYRYCQSLFQEKKSMYGDEFEKELRLFRAVNASYNKVHALAASAAHKLGMFQR